MHGFGERKTPVAFRNACDTFTYLDVLEEPQAAPATAAPSRKSTPELQQDTTLVGGLRTCITTASGEDGWANLAVVGSLMRKQQPDFDSRNWGFAKVSDLVKAIGLLVVEPRPGGGMQIRNVAK